MKEQVDTLSKVVGYDIKLNVIDGTIWAGILQSFGLTKLFANSFLHTVQIIDGVEKGIIPLPTKSSALLYATGWQPEYDLGKWCHSEHVLAAFKK